MLKKPVKFPAAKIALGACLVLALSTSSAFAEEAQAAPLNSVAPSASTDGGIAIPAPPPAPSISPEAAQLAKQAEEAAARAQTPVLPREMTAEEASAQAEAQAEADQLKREREHNEKSYDRASMGLLPLTPEQIRIFMQRLEHTQQAAQPPTEGPPKGKVRTVTLSLSPGVDPPKINLAAGYVTTIMMMDATGEPWPILDVGVGGNFEVSPTQAGSHVVRVMPLTRYGDGNLSVLLKDLPTPIIFRLASGSGEVDLRYDARVPKPGPSARAPLIGRPRLEAGDETIMMLLDDVPPKEARRIKVSGADGRTAAWLLNDRVYVRTPLTLLSPGWDASVSSADGMTVYQIGDAPVLLMSDNGAMVRARLTRDDGNDK